MKKLHLLQTATEMNNWWSSTTKNNESSSNRREERANLDGKNSLSFFFHSSVSVEERWRRVWGGKRAKESIVRCVCFSKTEKKIMLNVECIFMEWGKTCHAGGENKMNSEMWNERKITERKNFLFQQTSTEEKSPIYKFFFPLLSRRFQDRKEWRIEMNIKMARLPSFSFYFFLLFFWWIKSL